MIHVCAKFQCFLGSLRYQWTAMNIKDQLGQQMELRQLTKLDILQLWEVRKP